MKKLLHSKKFCWIARRIPPELAQKVEDAKIEGIFLVKEPKRFYPNGELAGQMVGLVGLDSVGLEGLEIRYDQYLKGVPEKLVWTRDAKGTMLYPEWKKLLRLRMKALILSSLSTAGFSILFESQLKAAVQDKGAKGGLAIVMDPKTGEILALANSPSFDPNALLSVSPENKKIKSLRIVLTPVQRSSRSWSPQPLKRGWSGRAIGSIAKMGLMPLQTGLFMKPTASVMVHLLFTTFSNIPVI